MTETAATLLDYWFDPANRKQWFQSTAAMDAALKSRFEPLYLEALAHQHDHWQAQARGTLALIIVFDQLPLNIYRATAAAFATDQRALTLAAKAVDARMDRELNDDEKAFLYMPFMHSESLADQQRSVTLYEQAGLDDNARFARHHRDIVQRFGRFPHRNALLGRLSTPAERDWLASDSAFTG